MTDWAISTNRLIVCHDKHYRSWLVVMTAALFFFYDFLQLNMFNAIQPELSHEFQITATQLGHLSAAYFYSVILLLFPAGLLLDRFSTRTIILVAMAISIWGTGLFATSHYLMLSQFARFVTGIGSAFCFLSAVRLATHWFSPQRMALVTGMIVTAAMLGGITAQTPLTLLVQMVGWRQALLLDTGFGFLLWILVYKIVQDYPDGRSIEIKQHRSALQSMGLLRSIQLSVLQKQNWLCSLYASLMNLPVFLFGAVWGSLFLTQVHQFTRTQASYVTSMIFLGAIVGSPAMGWFSDYSGRRKLPMIICALASLAVISRVITVEHASVNYMMLLFFLLGFVTSSQVISYPTVAESNPPSITATSVSIISIGAMLAGAIFQPLFGYFMDIHWNGQLHGFVRVYTPEAFHYALLIIPVAFFIALVAACLLQETNCRLIEF